MGIIFKTILLLAVCASSTFGQANGKVMGKFNPFFIQNQPISWSPSNILNLFGWWKADALTNLVDGSDVVNWIDSSGHNLTMGPETANTPYFTNSFQNSKPAVFFDGVNDYLTNAAAMNQSNVIFFVISHRIPNTASAYFWEARDTDGISQLSSQNFGWIGSIYTNGVAYAGIGMTVTNATTNVVTTYTVQFSNGTDAGSAGRIWTNGVAAIADQGCGFGNMLMGMNVGQGGPLHVSSFFKGYMLEMFCVTNTTITNTTILTDGCNYLRAKYAHY
jgi:hypothetical protein